MSDDLTELDIEVVTITCDGDGVVTFDAGGIDASRAVFLLRSAEFMLMNDHWFGTDEDEDEDD